MIKMSSAAAAGAKEALRDKIRGCLVGALIGDCLGAPVECIYWDGLSPDRVEKQFEKYATDSPGKIYKYTDDTAMARQVAQSLIEHKGSVNAEDMARKFQLEYFREPQRGYGGAVIEVFTKLRAQMKKEDSENSDCFQPAREQFDGSGSYGNGAAMRVHPFGIAAQNMHQVCEMAAVQSRLTHAHRDAVDGAVIQAAAVHLALTSTDTTSRTDFITSLMKEVSDTSAYDLSVINDLLDRDEPLETKSLVEALGNDVSALNSVPAAIFSFVKEAFEATTNDENPFLRTLKTALRFGGDSDTIGSMAGAIAGAKYGRSAIPDQLAKICEGVEHAEEQADEIYQLVKGH